MANGGDLHHITLSHGKANAIDGALLEFVSGELDSALAAKKTAVVLTGSGGFFSAGLDLKGLPASEEDMASFLDDFEAVMKKLLELPVPLVVAVNGHAIAGGCVLASTGDVRIGAAGDYRIGVSEVSLGIVFPASAFEIMRHTIEARAVPEVLLGGKLLAPDEAVGAGILHRVVPAGSLLEEAESIAKELGEKPPVAFRHSKLALRAPLLERIEATREKAGREFLRSWFSPDVVERRKAILAK
jgi:enoyl-CoA hydratase